MFFSEMLVKSVVDVQAGAQGLRLAQLRKPGRGSRLKIRLGNLETENMCLSTATSWNRPTRSRSSARRPTAAASRVPRNLTLASARR